MPGKLYDFGYQSIKTGQDLKLLAEALDAVVLDIRHSPKAKNPDFAGSNLATLLEARYQHVPELGNTSYKSTHGEITFKDFEAGAARVRALLEAGTNVIVMCACWQRTACHRYEFVTRFAKEYGEESTLLNSKSVTALKAASKPRAPEQIALFDDRRVGLVEFDE